MKEKLTRRNLLIGGLAAALGADTLYATRAFQPRHEITQETREWLETLAAELTNEMSSSGFEEPRRILPKIERTSVFEWMRTGQSWKEFKDKEVVVNASPNFQIFAQTLLQMAYLEGGKDETNKVNEFVHQKGLKIAATNFRESDSNSALVSGVMVRDYGNNPITLLLDNEIIADYFRGQPNPEVESVPLHELYHVIQYARNPEGFLTSEAIGSLVYRTVLPLSIAGVFGVETYKVLGNSGMWVKFNEVLGKNSPLERILGKNEMYQKTETILDNLLSKIKLNRRKLLQVEISFLLGLSMTQPAKLISRTTIQPLTDPVELQAYLQTGSLSPSLELLTNHPSFDPLRGRFFNFDEIKE